jgi:hypothetical protein
MHLNNNGTIVTAIAGTVATPGTVTGGGIDLLPGYLPEVSAIVSMGAVTAGTCVVHIQGGTAAADGSVDYGTIQVAGAAAGTQSYQLDVPNVRTRYLRALATVTGGTATVSAAILATPRTITD